MKYAKSHNVKPVVEPPKRKGGFRPLPKNLRAWAQTQSIRVELHVGRKAEHESEAEAYGAENVGLLIKVGRSSVWLALASLTEEELLAIRDVVVTACDSALPVCQYLDRVAQAAVDRGDEEIPPRAFKLAPMLIKKNNTTAYAPADNGEQHESNRARGGASPSGDEPPQAGLQQEHDQGIQF